MATWSGFRVIMDPMAAWVIDLGFINGPSRHSYTTSSISNWALVE